MTDITKIPIDWEMSGNPGDLDWAIGSELHRGGIVVCNELCHAWSQKAFRRGYSAMLAAERRATLARVRERLDRLPHPDALHVNRDGVREILDEEAAR